MATLVVNVRPNSDLDKVLTARTRLLVYYQEIVFTDDNGDIISREASTSVDVSPELVGIVEILDYTPDTSITFSITSSEGLLLLSEDVDKPDGNATDGYSAIWKLTKPEIQSIAKQIERSPLYSAILQREGQFIAIGFPLPDFAKYQLLISPIRQSEISRDTLNKLFGINSFGTASTRLLREHLSAIPNLPFGELITTRIGVVGQFEFTVPVEGNESGWIWLLNGPFVFIGIQAEEDLTPLISRRTILLPPPMTDNVDGENREIASTIPMNGVTEVGTEHISIDVSEDELLSNPDVFNDDPGTFCRPFSNPHRIVSERTFHTILRVEQPTVGSKSYVRPDFTRGLPEAPSSDVVAREALASAPSDFDDVGIANLSNRISEVVRAELNTARGVPAINFFEASFNPALNLDPSGYEALLREESRKVPRGRFVLSANKPLNWEGDSTEYQATSLAFGHILESRVQWRTNGYSLGRVIHSLTLAPRQTKRIVTIQSSIADRISRTEDTDFAESVDSETTRDYSYQDQVEAHLNEWSKGASIAGQTGGAGGIGGFINGVLFGGGAAFGIAAAGSKQSGGRDISATETQKLKDSLRTYGDSLRQLDSMVVVEQSQEEFVQGVSEIIRNINYCHSLTIIYHEILRHLRVDTRVVGARECIFVPFEIKPFTIARLFKWRETLRRVLRRRSLQWVMRYLPDKMNGFQGSTIPNKIRSQIPITNITGSIYIQLKIERPKDDDIGDFVEANWKTLLPLSFDPILSISNALASLETARKDNAFQSNYAPKIAVNWADKLKLYSQNNQPIDNVDFTLVSSYRYGRTLQIDFAISDPTGSLTRSNLKEIRVECLPLPVGSIANVRQIRFRYYTEYFDYQVASPRVTNDLIEITTGEPEDDADNQPIFIPTTPWEDVNLRTEINKAFDELLGHLNENIEYYHKMIWWNLDRDKLYMMLDGIKLSPEDERSVASVVERNPLAVVGNSLVYRVAGGAFIGVAGHQDADSLNYHYRDTNTRAEPLRISLPTSGLYAQSIMDECEACEEHYGSTEWVLTDDEPELAELAPELLASRRAKLPDATPSELPDSIINIQNAATPPAPSGFVDTLNALTNPSAFRDMAGLEGTQANSRAAMETAAKLASEFGSNVVDLYKARLSASVAKDQLSAIKKARDEGLIDDDKAKEAGAKTVDVLTEKTSPVTSNKDIEGLADAADSNDVDIDVKRPSGEQVSIRKSRSQPTSSRSRTDSAPSGDAPLTEVPRDDEDLIDRYVNRVILWNDRTFEAAQDALNSVSERMTSPSTADANPDILKTGLSSALKNSFKTFAGAFLSKANKPLGMMFSIVYGAITDVNKQLDAAAEAQNIVNIVNWINEQRSIVGRARNELDPEKLADDLRKGYLESTDRAQFMNDLFNHLLHVDQLINPVKESFEVKLYEMWINAHFAPNKVFVLNVGNLQEIRGCVQIEVELGTFLNGDGHNILSKKVIVPNGDQIADGLNAIFNNSAIDEIKNIIALKTRKVICYTDDLGLSGTKREICAWLDANNKIIIEPTAYTPLTALNDDDIEKLSNDIRLLSFRGILSDF